MIRRPMAPIAKEPTQPTMPPATIRVLASLWADILVAEPDRTGPWFAERQEWTVDETNIFKDDGISGGVFDSKQRPGLAALLDAARSRPRRFDVLVVMNQSRLARRQRYAVDIVHDLTDAGVRIFHYQTGLERKMGTSTDRFMVSVDGFSDESYRESIRITTRETMHRKAERGEVAGGKVYGYTNVCRACGAPTGPLGPVPVTPASAV